MQLSSRFTIAVHMLSGFAFFEGQRSITSEFLAGSIHVHPVVVCRLLLMLKTAGIIEVRRGRGGSHLARSPEEITLYDIYRATELLDDDKLFHFHEHPNPACPVGRNIHRALDGHLAAVQEAMEEKLRSIRLSDIIAELRSAACTESTEQNKKQS